MPTEKPRVTFTISPEKLSEVENYKFANRLKNQSQAILSLIEKGLSDYSFDEVKIPTLSREAQQLALDFDELDSHGQRVLRMLADEEKARCFHLPRTEDAKLYIMPCYFSAMSAGTGEIAADEYPEDYILKKRPPRGASYIAPVHGDSMEPTIHDGDKLFIRACTEIRPGKIGVFFMDGKMWIKELGDGVLISHNKKYDPIPMTEGIVCEGEVLGVCDESYFK